MITTLYPHVLIIYKVRWDGSPIVSYHCPRQSNDRFIACANDLFPMLYQCTVGMAVRSNTSSSARSNARWPPRFQADSRYQAASSISATDAKRNHYRVSSNEATGSPSTMPHRPVNAAISRRTNSNYPTLLVQSLIDNTG